MKQSNPALRLRSDSQLGPRTTVEVKHNSSRKLFKPEAYFVEMSVFKRDFPDRPVNDSDIVWEHIDGNWVQGVLWL